MNLKTEAEHAHARLTGKPCDDPWDILDSCAVDYSVTMPGGDVVNFTDGSRIERDEHRNWVVTETITEQVVIRSGNKKLMRVFRPIGQFARFNVMSCPADYDPALITLEDICSDSEITCYGCEMEDALRYVLGVNTKAHETITDQIVVKSADHPNKQPMRVFRPIGKFAHVGAISCPADYDPALITLEDTCYDDEITCYRSMEDALRDVLGFNTELQEKEEHCAWLRQERARYRDMWLHLIKTTRDSFSNEVT